MTERRILTVGQHRLASPAPPARDDDLPRETASDAHIDALATAWVRWHATRRFYGRDPRVFTPLGRLQPRGSSGRQPDAFASSELATFHVAVLSVPEDSIGRKVFEAHYLLRARPVAKAAAQLGISRPSWYKVLRRVRREIYATHSRLLSSV